jgi:hypothetical protein
MPLDFNIGYYLTIANMNEKLSKSRIETCEFHMDRCEMKTINDGEVKEEHGINSPVTSSYVSGSI